MTATAVVVPVAAGHAGVLAALHRLCFAGHPWHRPWDEGEMAAVLALPGGSGWLAKAADGEPVGLLLVQAVAEDADILTLGVRPGPWRRRGVGRALLAGAEAALVRQGVERLVLEVAGDNTGALCFYHRLGYKVVGTRPAYYCGQGAGPAADAVVMARQIAPPDGAADVG